MRPRRRWAQQPLDAAPEGFAAGARARLGPAHRRSRAVNARDERFAAATERAQPSPPHDELGSSSPALTDGGALESSSFDYWLLSRLRSSLGDPPVEFAMASGVRVGPGDGTPVARVTFASRAALASTMADPWLRFGDAYSDGLVAIDGDLVNLLASVYHSSSSGGGRASLVPPRPRGPSS